MSGEHFAVTAKNTGDGWAIFHGDKKVRQDHLLNIRQLGMEAAQLKRQSQQEVDVQREEDLKDRE